MTIDTWNETPGQRRFRIGVRSTAIDALLWAALDDTPDDEYGPRQDEDVQAADLLERTIRDDPDKATEIVLSLLEQAYDQGWNAALHNERSKNNG